jgi:hypothetical protein
LRTRQRKKSGLRKGWSSLGSYGKSRVFKRLGQIGIKIMSIEENTRSTLRFILAILMVPFVLLALLPFTMFMDWLLNEDTRIGQDVLLMLVGEIVKSKGSE